jgi:hypothetical protein
MKKRLPIAVAVAVAVSAIVAPIGVSSASAATEFGSGCAANRATEKALWVATGHSPLSPLPVTAPISGVITEWKVTSNQEPTAAEPGLVEEFPRIFQQRLLVLQSSGAESFKVVGEAAGGPLNLKGTSTYLARVPVQAGDFLGLVGDPYALACATENEADTIAATVGGAPIGSTFKTKAAKGIQVPVTARVEPDADGDGYGDETQDKCPQSAAYQTACPVVQVSSLAVSGRKAVAVYVASSLAAPVAVSATVTLAKGKTVTLHAPGKTVSPGTLAHFSLALTKPLRAALKALPTKKSLQLSITAGATNVTGDASVATSTLKLRGEARPVHRTRVVHGSPAHHKKPPHHKKTV